MAAEVAAQQVGEGVGAALVGGAGPFGQVGRVGRVEVFGGCFPQGDGFGVQEAVGDTPAVHQFADAEPALVVVSGGAVVDEVGPVATHRGEVGGVHGAGRFEQRGLAEVELGFVVNLGAGHRGDMGGGDGTLGERVGDVGVAPREAGVGHQA